MQTGYITHLQPLLVWEWKEGEDEGKYTVPQLGCWGQVVIFCPKLRRRSWLFSHWSYMLEYRNKQFQVRFQTSVFQPEESVLTVLIEEHKERLRVGQTVSTWHVLTNAHTARQNVAGNNCIWRKSWILDYGNEITGWECIFLGAVLTTDLTSSPRLCWSVVMCLYLQNAGIIFREAKNLDFR